MDFIYSMKIHYNLFFFVIHAFVSLKINQHIVSFHDLKEHKITVVTYGHSGLSTNVTGQTFLVSIYLLVSYFGLLKWLCNFFVVLFENQCGFEWRWDSFCQDDEARPESITSFKRLLNKFPATCLAAAPEDISAHLCFICLLHLANEHNLRIQGCPSLDDLFIFSIPNIDHFSDADD